MSIQSSSLVLRSRDIGSTDDETVQTRWGSWENDRQKHSFIVDLRTCIGPAVYDRHDKFILRLNQLSHTASNFRVSAADENVHLRISGLSWLNSSYDVRTQSNGHYVDILSFYMQNNTSKAIFLSPNVAQAVFQKSNDFATIQVELIRTIDNTPAQTGSVFPFQNYHFDIIPIE